MFEKSAKMLRIGRPLNIHNAQLAKYMIASKYHFVAYHYLMSDLIINVVAVHLTHGWYTD